MEELREYIPAVGNLKTDKLHEEVKMANDRLSHLPGNVDEYVEFMSFLSSVSEGMKRTESRMFVIFQTRGVFNIV